MTNFLLSLVCAEEEVGQGVNKNIFNLPLKCEGELLTIEGDPSGGGY